MQEPASRLTIERSSFSPFVKRALKFALPHDVFVLGYSVFNRNCTVTSSPQAAPFEATEDNRLSQTTTRIGEAIFQVSNASSHFPIQASRDVAVVFSDRSKSLRVTFGGHTHSRIEPMRDSTSVASKGDQCLLKLEHMQNTIHKKSTVTYERRDDVVVCTDMPFMEAGTPLIAIESRRDVRFLQFLSSDICAEPLRIPINRRLFVFSGDVGTEGAVATECGAGTFTQVAPVSTITMK